MCITAAKVCKLIDRALGIGGVDGADRESNKNLVGVKSGVMVAKMLDLEMLDGLDDLGGHKMLLVVDSRQSLGQVLSR